MLRKNVQQEAGCSIGKEIGLAVTAAVLAFTLLLIMVEPAAPGEPQTLKDESNIIQVPAFDLPLSSFLSGQERDAIGQWRLLQEEAKGCFSGTDDQSEIPDQRRCLEEQFFTPIIAKYNSLYAVRIEPEVIAGVKTEIFMPVDAIAPKNRERVLINLHGGAFIVGARYGGQVESIPIAAVGKIKVISVDYRMAPEHKFPAASEDVAQVYRALLQHYKPKNIGIYGCSAGGLLTAEAVAWFQKEGLPMPGAVGMLCEGAGYWSEGDSAHLSAAIAGASAEPQPVGDNPYFKDTVPRDPLAFPVHSPAIMEKFPPSLLISSTRDVALSSVAHTHAQLVKLGVEADLHVWEGLDHAFFYDPGFPQSREVYDVVANFFDEHLGMYSDRQ